MTYPDPLIIDTQTDCDIAVIWLHGLGADGYDFQDIVPALQLPNSLKVRFIFPHASELAITANGGYIMRAWYDILEFSESRRINHQQLEDSVSYVESLIKQQEKQGINSERIIIAGFSQGGAVAYQAALNFPRPLAGLLIMSSYVADPEALVFASANKTLPILIQHGQFDPVVLESQADKAIKLFAQSSYVITRQRYPTEHHLCEAQCVAIGQWLTTLFH